MKRTLDRGGWELGRTWHSKRAPINAAASAGVPASGEDTCTFRTAHNDTVYEDHLLVAFASALNTTHSSMYRNQVLLNQFTKPPRFIGVQLPQCAALP